MDNTDIESLIREQIEAPAARQIQSMLATGQITAEDAELFRISAHRFKTAALAEYDGFDPTVRHQLIKAVLTNYDLEIRRLLEDVGARARRPARAPLPVAGPPTEAAQADNSPAEARRSFRKILGTILGRD